VYYRADDLVFRDFGDGEYRGEGHYCLLPPSRHPFGMIYRWLIPLPAGPLPFIADVAAGGFLNPTPQSVTLVTECTESTESTEDNRGLLKAVMREGHSSTSSVERSSKPPPLTEIDADVERMILETLPAGVGRRNYQVFQLARSLKAIPRLADAPVDSLEPYVRRWHHLGVASKVIGTEGFESTWVDFLLAWPKVKFPKGAEPMAGILEKAKTSPIPQAALKYDHPGLWLLVGLCRELQRVSGDKPFFLSCETARKLLKLPNRMDSWRMLFLLRHDRVIEEVEKGGPGKRRASRYRYLGD
jgi:hypothetical protein